MEQEKKIRELMIENENLAAHFRRISKKGYQLHRMDVDVMLNKTRQLYEHLLELHAQLPAPAYERESETTPIQKSNAGPKAGQEASPHAQPEPEAVDEQSEEAPVVTSSQPAETEPEQNQTSPADIEIEEEIAETNEPERKTAEAEKQPLTDENDDTPAPVDESTEATLEGQPHNQVTAFDLFSQDATESLGEKLVPNEDYSIAARMQQSPIKDLREAIGINEKFLFINELFRGNLNQYNKSIDELNALESINGAFTCLIELKVQHQWDEKGAAFKKLKELIERKFKQG